MRRKIVLLPGDGIGPEVIEATQAVLESVAGHFGHRFEFQSHAIGGKALDESGRSLPATTVSACLDADAILHGAVGGPEWAHRSDDRPENGILNLRRELQVYANLRPIKVLPAMVDLGALKPTYMRGVDILIVRELTGGLYFGVPRFREQISDGEYRAVDTMEYTTGEIKRLVKVGFNLARQRRQKVTSVDKANVLETSRLWQEVVDQVALDYPGVTVEHQLMDSAAARLIREAALYDVIIASNLFGDILTDEAALLAGSIGTIPSASIGDEGPGLYEPVHGAAPSLVGKDKANPLGAILSGAMLLRHSFGLEEEALAIEHAANQCLADGIATADLGGKAGLKGFTEGLIARI